MKRHLFLFALLPTLCFGQIEGDWHGAFVIAGTTMRVDMKIDRSIEQPEIFLTDPDGSYENQKMSDVTVSDTHLFFKWTKVGAAFEADYFATGDSIYGIMSQMDVKWDITFYREEQALPVVNRPQEPKEPFAYTEERVMIPNGDISLGATLTMPLHYHLDLPIVVLASGSGPQNRDCELMGHKPFWIIADHLAKHGIATLRFDDRGLGESTGSFANATLEDFANDVEACVDYLSKQKRFKKNPIGIAGHSEGGLHALMAAKGNCKIDFIIELASAGTSGREVLVEQQYLIPLQSGESEEMAQWNRSVYAGSCDIVSKYDQKQAQDSLIVFLTERYEAAPEDYRMDNSKAQFLVGIGSFINSAWMRQFIAYEAKDYLKKVKIPILAINGGKDIQVPAVSNNAGFLKHFSKKSAKKSSAIIVDGLNHLFQECNSCTVMEYGELEETFSPKVLTMMSDWILGMYPMKHDR